MKKKLGICGITGRMGKTVLENAKKSDVFGPIFGFARTLPSKDDEFELSKSFEHLLKNSDVIIDFSLPEACLHLLDNAKKIHKPLVIGTTGFSSNQMQKIKELATSLPIVYSTNFSMGIALCLQAVEFLSKHLPSSFHAGIVETHHIHKKDSPSGTALSFASSIKRNATVTSHREGSIVGKHQIFFESTNEKIELCHEAFSREAFALGALFSAEKALYLPAGLYSLKDLIDTGRHSQ